MNGKLWIESELGQGTKVHVSFSLQLAPEQPVGLPVQEVPPLNWLDQPGEKQVSILLADDNQINLMVAGSMLQKLGYDATRVENGKQVLAMLQTRHFDLILMDMLMPEMDGLDATRIIRDQEIGTQCHMPIIALTASALKEDRQRCLDAGMDDYISKPFHRWELDACIQALLHRSSRTQGIRAVSEQESRLMQTEQRSYRAKYRASEPLYDEAKINEYQALDKQLLINLVSIFEEETAAELRAAQEAIQAKDSKQLQFMAHSLKNSIGNFTEKALYGLALELEHAGQAADFSDSEEIFQKLSSGIEELNQELGALLGNI